MPRSTKSRRVNAEPVVVDEVQDAPVAEALDNAEGVTFDERMTDEEKAAFADMLGVTEAAPEPEGDPREWTVDALHGRDFDWETMSWTPRKANGSGTRPCLCNRIAGHECDLTTKSRFSIGHDARFKGILQTAFRQGRKLRFMFEAEDKAQVLDVDGHAQLLIGELELEADAIARLVAPQLLKWVTHTSRSAKLQKLDADAGTTVPQTAVDNTPDEELTDADIEAQVDDAEGADAGH